MVAELVPSGFAAYLRVFHPFEAMDGSGSTRSWHALAKDVGVRLHAELSHRFVSDEDMAAGRKPRWLTASGQPDKGTRQALARALARTTGDQPVFFAYDVAALLWGQDAPLVRRSSLASLEAVRAAVAADAGGMEGPEFWWPQDRSWVVTSDIDLVSTYVGCSAEATEDILNDPEIEALLVTPDTQVDFSADQASHRFP
ncbi:hypothetical protein [Streptomyces sp. SID1034]|uniref:hypothetical protein n=1 Tax=Streptomyces sp. SID1034 TaxID=2690248 RepID=UPI00136BA16B|nr:hypothetical protein [Streptomyces sp. SID1034]MYV90533.1 hypothetical protein [Streptomyces sp. SID1034]